MSATTTIHVWESSNHERKNWPVTVSVPFASGLIHEPRQVILRDPRSSQIPAQRRVLSTWADGSIKWLLLDFPIDLEPREHLDIVVEVSEDPVGVDAHDGLRVEWAGENLHIDTGALQCELASEAGGLLHSLTAHGVQYISEAGTIQLRQPSGRILDISDGPSSVEIEENGSQRAVIAITGKHGDAENSSIDYVLRLEAYAHQPMLHWTYAITNRENDNIPISSLQLSQPIDLDPKNNWAIVGTDQTRYDMPESWISVTTEGLETNATDGHRTSGNINTIRAEVKMEPFLVVGDNERMVLTLPKWAHFLYPKAIHYYGHSLRYDVWPETAGTWDMKRGMAKTHEMTLRFSPPADGYNAIMPEVAPVLRPLTPVVPSDYIASTWAIAELFPAKADTYPVLETRLTRAFSDRAQAYGMLNYGDAPSPAYTAQGRGRRTKDDEEALVWVNNEYDLPYTAMLQFLRTGDPIVWREHVEPTIWHMMDVDTVHYDPDNALRDGGQVTHCADHVGPPGGSVDPSHEWVEGLILYHELTGLEYPKERALALGEHLIRWTTERRASLYQDKTAARVCGWALIALTALYEFTHDERYLEASLEHANGIASRINEGIGHLTETVSYGFPYRAGFMTDIAIIGLKRLHQVSSDDTWKNLALGMLDDQLEHLMGPAGILWYKELPENHRPLIGLYDLEPLAYAYRWSGNKDYLKLGLRLLSIAGPHTIGQYTHGVFLRDAPGGAMYEEVSYFKRDAHSLQWIRYMLPFYRLLEELGLLKELEPTGVDQLLEKL
jgi:hypothetical protein